MNLLGSAADITGRHAESRLRQRLSGSARSGGIKIRSRLQETQIKVPSAARPGSHQRLALVTKPGATIVPGGTTLEVHRSSIAAPYAGGPSLATLRPIRQTSTKPTTSTSTTTTSSTTSTTSPATTSSSTSTTTPTTTSSTTTSTSTTTPTSSSTTTSTTSTTTAAICIEGHGSAPNSGHCDVGPTPDPSRCCPYGKYCGGGNMYCYVPLFG